MWPVNYPLTSLFTISTVHSQPRLSYVSGSVFENLVRCRVVFVHFEPVMSSLVTRPQFRCLCVRKNDIGIVFFNLQPPTSLSRGYLSSLFGTEEQVVGNGK